MDAWKESMKVVSQFWDVWRKQYLASLREQHTVAFSNRNTSTISPEVGVVVLVKNNLPRPLWRVGRISSVRKSADDQIRSVTVRLSNGKQVARPIRLLYPIESQVAGVNDNLALEPENASQSAKEISGSGTASVRPIRRAAKVARIKNQLILCDSDDDSDAL
jgi:hypothetical protein